MGDRLKEVGRVAMVTSGKDLRRNTAENNFFGDLASQTFVLLVASQCERGFVLRDVRIYAILLSWARVREKECVQWDSMY